MDQWDFFCLRAILEVVRQKPKLIFLVSKFLRQPIGEEEKGEKKEKREERKEKEEEKVYGQGMRCDFFSPHSSFSSDLQVESRERSQGKPRTSKFLMVGKLDFDVFHT